MSKYLFYNVICKICATPFIAQRKDTRVCSTRCHNKAPQHQEANRLWRRAACKRLKLAVLEAYGSKCICCNETRIEFLTIDHIDGKGHLHRKEKGVGGGNSFYYWLKRNNYPKDNFRCLCMNCNFARGQYGICPHETERKVIA